MKDLTSPPHVSDKSVEQLQEEFRTLNEQAMEIQAELAAIAEQLTASGVGISKPANPNPPGKDTVRF